MRWLSFDEMPRIPDRGTTRASCLTPDLVAHLQPHLLASCRGLVGSGEAEDLAQEVWVAALERPPRESAPAAVLGYLRSIARNLAAEHFEVCALLPAPLAYDLEGTVTW